MLYSSRPRNFWHFHIRNTLMLIEVEWLLEFLYYHSTLYRNPYSKIENKNTTMKKQLTKAAVCCKSIFACLCQISWKWKPKQYSFKMFANRFIVERYIYPNGNIEFFLLKFNFLFLESFQTLINKKLAPAFS